MVDFLQSLSQGLRGAAGVLSPDVYSAQMQQDELRRQEALQQRKEKQTQQAQQMNQIKEAIQNGSMDAAAGNAQLKALGYTGPDITAGPLALERTQKLKAEQTTQEQQQKYRDALRDVSALSGQTNTRTGKPYTEEELGAKIRAVHVQYAPVSQLTSIAGGGARDVAVEESKRLNRELSLMRIENERQRQEDIRAGRAEKISAKEKQHADTITNLVSEIDGALKIIEENPHVVGGRGMVERGLEFVGSTITGGGDTPASRFQQQVRELQSDYRTGKKAGMRLKSDEAKMDQIISGLGAFTSSTQAVNNLKQLKRNLLRSVGQTAPEGDTGMPLEEPLPTTPPKAVGGPQPLSLDAYLKSKGY